jgi:hypothetical protein
MRRLWLHEFTRQLFGIPSRKRTITRRKRANRKPVLEALEIRLVPTTYTVTNTNDTGAGKKP